MSVNRNEACPCGSGKKFKACCAGKRPTSHWVATVSVVVFALLGAWVLSGALRDAGKKAVSEPDQIWSEEHGHFHAAPGTANTPQPPGPAPPGKEWNREHGHWHDAALPGEVTPQGEGDPGQVWSVEHGHWHDAEPAAAGAPADTVEEGVSYIDESSP